MVIDKGLRAAWRDGHCDPLTTLPGGRTFVRISAIGIDLERDPEFFRKLAKVAVSKKGSDYYLLDNQFPQGLLSLLDWFPAPLPGGYRFLEEVVASEAQAGDIIEVDGADAGHLVLKLAGELGVFRPLKHFPPGYRGGVRVIGGSVVHLHVLCPAGLKDELKRNIQNVRVFVCVLERVLGRDVSLNLFDDRGQYEQARPRR